MSSNLDSPTLTRTAVELQNNSQCKGDCCEGKAMDKEPTSSPAGKRRVFVKTDNGYVLGMELDRRDNGNAHTVKRKLQLAFKVPTNESPLTSGGIVLNDDRKSLSTPWLSPSRKAVQQRDKSDIIEILGSSNSFAEFSEQIKEMVNGIMNGVDPIPVESGLGGVYHFRNCKGESIGIVKPIDEEPFAPNNPKGFLGKALGEPGLMRSVRVGETGYREVAAYLLDYGNFAKVPPTALVKISHSIFNVNENVNSGKFHDGGTISKIASLQQFVSHDSDACDHGTSNFPVADVHRIGILDVRIFNTDRHAGNLLVRKLDGSGRFGQVELIPIDHGLCLPEGLEDPHFEWMYWLQASIPFSEEEREYIRNLDPLRDCEKLRTELPMIREACLRILVLCTTFLKEATVSRLCLADIGEMMTREYRSYDQEPSEFEILCLEAKRRIAEKEVLLADPRLKDEFQFAIDYEDTMTKLYQDTSEDFSHILPGLDSVLKLDEFDGKEETEVNQEIINMDYPSFELLTASKLSRSKKKIDLVQKSKKNPELARLAGSSDVLSAEELFPATTGFLNLADLSEKESVLFLEKFQELLAPAFASRKSSSISQKQRKRLETSCQF